jgi:hypothetical protein
LAKKFILLSPCLVFGGALLPVEFTGPFPQSALGPGTVIRSRING